ncbi:CLUMA_CG021148, isoform A [Clunio marinus]|uniref:CLUMA_CG021148, isoform A n=1 Tax=Clunio marinus TaxID=568069 RepID=A0A1J1J7E4_9DIPT|nr:CLUMA_CG021148, isoform A [Clunio marinus]
MVAKELKKNHLLLYHGSRKLTVLDILFAVSITNTTERSGRETLFSTHWYIKKTSQNVKYIQEEKYQPLQRVSTERQHQQPMSADGEKLYVKIEMEKISVEAHRQQLSRLRELTNPGMRPKE